MQRLLRVTALAGFAAQLFFGCIKTLAHESDNFHLPLKTELADLGPFLETAHTIALQEAVAEINARIERALLIKDEDQRARRLQECHDPLALADAFVKRFDHPLFEDSQMYRSLSGAWARRSYAGQKTAHRDVWLHFAAHVPFDLRRWMMLTQSRTVKAYGVYFGGDKMVHFHHLGADYYRKYRSLIQAGLSKEAAYGKVIEHYAQSGFWSEDAMFGLITTGIYSNADLAANHAGFKFFLNLTEKIRLKGTDREPIIVRSGVFWRLNQYVRPRSGWLSAFFTDHWNEALNPNLYDASMRPCIRLVLQSRAKSIVQFYTQKDKRPDNPEYFDQLARELSTSHGEPYGHSGRFEKLMTIGNTCIPAVRRATAKPASP